MKKSFTLWEYLNSIYSLIDIKVIRCILILLLVTVFQAHAEKSYPHNARLNMQLNDVTVQNVLDEIENQSEFFFLFNRKLVDVNRRVDVSIENKDINETLAQVFQGEDVNYLVIDRQIVLSTSDYPIDAKTILQPRAVSGLVSGQAGEPLIGVSISIKGTTVGTITDLNGNYTLPDIPEDATLLFSYIGMTTQEIAVGNQTSINVTMEEDVLGLEEVVVVGYGTMKKRHLTGAIGSMQMDEDLESRPIVDFGQAMYGKIAGVQVLNASGRPGQDSRIQIRGINSISAGSEPLIVIDGVILPDFNLNSINPSDIESIEVLKDAASAAIYGSRAANGVILVTTKTGTPGRSTMTFNYSYTSQRVMNKVDVLNGPEYAQAAIDAAQNGWIDSGGDPNAPNTIEARGQYKYTWPDALERPETLWNTDFQDLIYRVAPMHKANLSFSGGGIKSTYYVSAGVVNQTGIVKKSEYQKYTLNMKGDASMNDWLTVGGMLNVAYDYEQVNHGNVVQGAVQYPSIYPVYGNQGYLGGPNSVDGFENHYGILIRAYNSHPLHWNADNDYRNTLNLMSNLFAEINILSNLKFRSTFSSFIRRYDRRYYRPGDTGLATRRTARTQSDANRSLSYNFDNTISYNYTLNKHQFDAVAGYELNFREGYNLTAQRREYDNDLVEYLSVGSLVYDAGDGASEYSMISVFGRINYNYSDKYLASATFRRDGSSRFGPGNKWGNFPSLSAGWRISEESFMEDVDILSNLTIRASYGITGNDNFGNYRWVSSMSQGKVAIGNNLYTSYFPSGIMNPDLAWERTIVTNLGLDIGLINNRITLGADYYSSESDGLLLNVPVPSTSGFTSVFRNIGAMESKGVELTLTTHNLTGKLSWNSYVTFARNQSKILKLGPDDAPMILSRSNMGIINQIGEAPFSFFAYKYDGVYMNQAEIEADPLIYPFTVYPGDGRYVDVNEDGYLSPDDRTIIGNGQPDFTWALTNNLSYKNFDLSFMFHGSVGGDYYFADNRRSLFYHEGRNYLGELRNRWRSEQEPGDGYYYKLTVDIDGLEKTASSYWITDGTYLRFKDVTLSYTIPSHLVEKWSLSDVRLFINATNLFTIQSTSAIDPENFSGNETDPANVGVQHSVYPTASTVSLGINVNF